ncbi:hypothetical protein FRX31_017609 [Thalictrum thalictroides]|uniref:Cysteine-rich receptor-like protein kinase n=1 Tax=Thalictrum thalictroides TaxID=46969 RepID=A0A7J6W715_THATH|nr:hypothetical protein FRX31_017609 [Thalictrum thalictroides]
MSSELEDYFEQINKEMKILIALRDDVITRGETQLKGWLQIVKKKEDEIDEMEKDLKNLRSYQIDAKKKLKDRLISCLKALKALVTSKDDISDAMKEFISEAATGKPKQYSCTDLKKYTSDPTAKIGSGVFGVVYKGTLNGVQVAIKKWEDGNSFAKQVWEKYQSKKLDEMIRDCGIEKGDEEKAKTLAIVALLCIEHMPKDRPSMIEVVNILTDVIPPKEPQNPYL